MMRQEENKHFLPEVISFGGKLPNLDKPFHYVEENNLPCRRVLLYFQGEHFLPLSITQCSHLTTVKKMAPLSLLNCSNHKRAKNWRKKCLMSTNELLYETIQIKYFKSRNKVFREQYFDYLLHNSYITVPMTLLRFCEKF